MPKNGLKTAKIKKIIFIFNFFLKKVFEIFFSKKKFKINEKTKGTFTLTTFKVVRVKVILFL